MSHGVSPPKPVTINGVRYDSYTKAGRAFGVSRKAIALLVERRGDVVEGYQPKAPCPPKPTEYAGKHYPSQRAAAKANGIDPHKFYRCFA